MTKRSWLKMLIKERIPAEFILHQKGADKISGVPLALGEKWLLLQCIYDFTIDGYFILRISDIIDGDYKKKGEIRILKKEGVIKKSKFPATKIKLDSSKNLFTCIKQLPGPIEFHFDKAKRLYMGNIIRVNKKSVQILTFDVCAKWNPKPVKVKFKNIDYIRFETNYCNLFARHIKDFRKVIKKSH